MALRGGKEDEEGAAVIVAVTVAVALNGALLGLSMP